MPKVHEIRKSFKNKNLLDQALTHRSWVNENPGIRDHNERLEFLGDAILEFVVSNFLYEKFNDKEEGFLTALRANLVNTQNLAKLARKIGAGESLFLSKGEKQGGGENNSSLLANTLEAIIGALYLDQGLPATSDFISSNLLSDLPKKLKEPLKDPKSRFQEEIQSKGLPTPRYVVVKESGPDHDKHFIINVLVGNENYGTGEGKSKNQAEQEAAHDALVKIGPKG